MNLDNIYDQFTDNKRLKITKFLIQETGTYNPMYIRPYVTHVTSDTANTIAQRVEQSGTVTAGTFSGLTSSLISPSSSAMGEIPIPNGWTEKRLSFLLTLELESSLSGNKIIYVQGFSDYMGVSYNGAIDPNMKFFINSITVVSRNTINTPMGVQYMDRVTETAQVINGKLFVDHSYDYNGVYGLRPYDIFMSAQTSSVRQAYKNLNDTRVRLDNSATLTRSSRKNNVPTSYMATLVDSYTKSSELSAYGGIPADVYSNAASMATDTGVINNEFIRALEFSSGVPNPTFFNSVMLEHIDPNLANVTNFIKIGNTQLVGLHTAGETEYWGGAGRETVAATLLSNAIPALMLEYMINKIYFRSTNHDITGQMNTVLIDAKSITNLDLSKSFAMFKYRLENEILFDLTFGNQIAYMLEVSCDVFGESRISISLDSGPMIVFATPSFCDSLIAPVYTTNKDILYTVSHDMEQIFSNISNSSHTQPMINNLI